MANFFLVHDLIIVMLVGIFIRKCLFFKKLRLFVFLPRLLICGFEF
jgi:hypothetical protein